jgi:hypothetical protein
MESKTHEIYFFFNASCIFPNIGELQPNIPLPAIPKTKDYIEIVSTHTFVSLHLSRLSSPKYRATALAALEGIIQIIENDHRHP